MKVVDKEAKRIEKQNTPEGKRAKRIKNLVFAVFIIVFGAFLYLYNHHPMFIGTPHIVTVGGVTVEPGETTVRELGASGFSLSDYRMQGVSTAGGQVKIGYDEIYDMSSPVEPKSYYSLLKLVRDGLAYATISVVNESSSEKTLADCKIRSITIYSSDEGAQTASIDGISMEQLNPDTLVQAAGDPKSTEDDSSSDEKRTASKWEKGNYSMELSVREDGTVYSFTSSYEKK